MDTKFITRIGIEVPEGNCNKACKQIIIKLLTDIMELETLIGYKLKGQESYLQPPTATSRGIISGFAIVIIGPSVSAG